jgi:hypothetical protein
MRLSTVIALSLTTICSTSAQALPSLIDALRNAGSSKFAKLIEADPNIASIYISNQVQTVFAPTDNAVGESFASSCRGKRQILLPPEEQTLLLHATQRQTDLQNLRTLPGGSQIVTKDTSANLMGQPQSVVSDARDTTPSPGIKRWVNASMPSLVKISSGLGNNVNVIKANIPYCGGLIHITDG